MTTTHGAELQSWANKKIAALEEELTRYKCDHQLLLEERDALFAERRDLRAALAAAPNPWPSPYPAGTPGPICEKLRAYDLWDIQRQAALVTS